jgi:hypothetical protein
MIQGSVAHVTGANRGQRGRIEQMGALWNKSHKEYERAFASF